MRFASSDLLRLGGNATILDVTGSVKAKLTIEMAPSSEPLPASSHDAFPRSATEIIASPCLKMP